MKVSKEQALRVADDYFGRLPVEAIIRMAVSPTGFSIVMTGKLEDGKSLPAGMISVADARAAAEEFLAARKTAAVLGLSTDCLGLSVGVIAE